MFRPKKPEPSDSDDDDEDPDDEYEDNFPKDMVLSELVKKVAEHFGQKPEDVYST